MYCDIRGSPLTSIDVKKNSMEWRTRGRSTRWDTISYLFSKYRTACLIIILKYWKRTHLSKGGSHLPVEGLDEGVLLDSLHVEDTELSERNWLIQTKIFDI